MIHFVVVVVVVFVVVVVVVIWSWCRQIDLNKKIRIKNMSPKFYHLSSICVILSAVCEKVLSRRYYTRINFGVVVLLLFFHKTKIKRTIRLYLSWIVILPKKNVLRR